MAWMQLTLENGEQRLINLAKFIFAQKRGSGTYLIATETSQSIAVRESLFYIAKKLDALPDGRMRGEDALFKNSTG